MPPGNYRKLRIFSPRCLDSFCHICTDIMHALFDRSPSFSFEFFPPKTPQGAESLLETVIQLQEFHPSFVSVTYGASPLYRISPV